ncbi:hypothetical protein ACH4LT_30330 [Streptomyces clavifer]|uniref:hypothetical protein n=1 Tax=Streptomyces clavifer TaxID=68188 RepID=UPI00378754C7
MASEVVVKVSWGPRPESPRELADRWLTMLGGLAELSDGTPVDWRWDRDGDRAGEPVPADAGRFAAVLEAGGPEEDADIIGWTAAVVGTWKDRGYARLRVQGGGSDEYTPFTAVLQLFPAPGGTTAPPVDRLPESLAVLADAWDADTGLTYDRKLFNAVKSAFGLRNSHPRCGWAVYLSENRAALVPADLSAGRLRAGRGGIVLALGDSTEAVLTAQQALTDAGALNPIPPTSPRPTW